MRILFVISVVAFVALLWASIAMAQHIRRSRRRGRLADTPDAPDPADPANILPWLAEGETPAVPEAKSAAPTTDPNIIPLMPPPPRPAPGHRDVPAPPPLPPAPAITGAPVGASASVAIFGEVVRFPLSSQRSPRPEHESTATPRVNSLQPRNNDLPLSGAASKPQDIN